MSPGNRHRARGSGVPAPRSGGRAGTTDTVARPGQDEGMESRDWIRDGVRAWAHGALAVVLSLLNIPLFVLFVVSLVLTPVLGLGLVLLPLVTALIRGRAQLARRLAG